MLFRSDFIEGGRRLGEPAASTIVHAVIIAGLPGTACVEEKIARSEERGLVKRRGGLIGINTGLSVPLGGLA